MRALAVRLADAVRMEVPPALMAGMVAVQVADMLAGPPVVAGVPATVVHTAFAAVDKLVVAVATAAALPSHKIAADS